MKRQQTLMNNPIKDMIVESHQQMENLMMAHQEALLNQKLTLAKSLLEQFKRLLDVHIEIEDELINPIHEKISQPRWQTKVYLAEHNKIPELLQKVFDLLDVIPDSQPERNRAILAVLDHERTFKNVMEHHEQREEQGQLPELKTHLENERYDQLLSDCTARLKPVAQDVEATTRVLVAQIYDKG